MRRNKWILKKICENDWLTNLTVDKTKRTKTLNWLKLKWNYKIILKLKNNTIKKIEEIKEFDVLCWKLKSQEN
jgi:hypothetical protein